MMKITINENGNNRLNNQVFYHYSFRVILKGIVSVFYQQLKIGMFHIIDIKRYDSINAAPPILLELIGGDFQKGRGVVIEELGGGKLLDHCPIYIIKLKEYKRTNYLHPQTNKPIQVI